MDDLEQEFIELEGTISDPVFEAIIADTRELNHLAGDENIPESELIRAATALNQRWCDSGLNRAEIYVSGHVILGEEPSYDQRMTYQHALESYYYIHKPLHGSRIGLMQTVTPTEEGIVSAYQFIVEGEILVEDDTVEGGTVRQWGQVAVDEQNIFEYESLTPARANAWLDVYYPDLKEELVGLLVAADTEVEATLLLAQQLFPVTDMAKIQRKELQKHLEVYLNDYLRYDQNVPYLAEVLGTCEMLPDGAGTFKDYDIQDGAPNLFIIKELFFRHDKSLQQLTPWITGSLLKKNNKLIPIRFPLDAVYNLTSGRSIFEAYLQQNH